MIHKILKNFFVLAFILVFGGCLGKELPTIQHYELSLDAEVLMQKEAKRATTTQQVRNPSSFVYLGTEASLKIANKKIAYKTSANTIEYFIKNEWIEPLPLMVDSLVLKISKLRELTLAKEVKAGIPTFALNILDFYYDEKQEIVVLTLLVKCQNSSYILDKETKVQKGRFDEIIKAMNQTINSALLDAFSLLK